MSNGGWTDPYSLENFPGWGDVGREVFGAMKDGSALGGFIGGEEAPGEDGLDPCFRLENGESIGYFTPTKWRVASE